MSAIIRSVQVVIKIFILSLYCSDGVPTDGTPRVNIVTVSLGNIVCFTLLGVIGIFYALAYMLFNYINRHKKYDTLNLCSC